MSNDGRDTHFARCYAPSFGATRRRHFCGLASVVLVALWFRGCGTVDVDSCAAAETRCPEVTEVGGTGAPGPEAKADNRLRDSLVLTGKNLANASVVFSGAAYDRQVLSQRGPATNERVEVLLPVDVTPNRYTLSVTNADGTQEIALQILRGEPGSYTIGHGLNLSGDVLSVVLQAQCPAGTELVGFDAQAQAICKSPWERGWKYRLPVTVDTANYGRLINENVWARIDFGAALIAAGVSDEVSIDPESVRVVDETIRPFAEVPSKILRTYDSPNDGYLWFNTQSTIDNGHSRTFYVYFTDEAKRKPRYHLQPPPDVAVTYHDNSILVIRGDYAGHFSARMNSIPTIGSGSHNCVGIGDFDNDGDLDYVIVRNGNEWVHYVENTGRGDGFSSFMPPFPVSQTPVAREAHCMGIAVADYNQDGNLDVIVERDDNPIKTGIMRLLVGRGDGFFENTAFEGAKIENCFYRELDVADFDKDSFVDVVQGTYDPENKDCPWYVYWGAKDRPSSFSAYPNDGVSRNRFVVTAGDFTDDGFPDVLIGGKAGASASRPGFEAARAQFNNAGDGTQNFSFEGYWPYIKDACVADNVHGWAKAYDWDHDGFDDVIGSLYCDGNVNKQGVWYWHRNSAEAWQFDKPILVAPASGPMWTHGVTAPRLGNALNFVVTPGAVAEVLVD